MPRAASAHDYLWPCGKVRGSSPRSFVRANRSSVVPGTKFGYTRAAERPEDGSLSNRPDYIPGALAIEPLTQSVRGVAR